MNKYDNAKFLKETKARVVHICDKCGKQIESGETYYPESIGRINAPGINLKKFCKDCYQKYGDKLLQKNFNGAPASLAQNSAAAENEGGQKFLPPNPLPFCPPERKLSKVSVRIFAEKSSDFVQDRQIIQKNFGKEMYI